MLGLVNVLRVRDQPLRVLVQLFVLVHPAGELAGEPHILNAGVVPGPSGATVLGAVPEPGAELEQCWGLRGVRWGRGVCGALRRGEESPVLPGQDLP